MLSSSWTAGYLPPRELPKTVTSRERHQVMLTMLNGRPLEEGTVRDAAVADMRTIAMFDEILRQEGNVDVFNSRVYDDDSDDEEQHHSRGTITAETASSSESSNEDSEDDGDADHYM